MQVDQINRLIKQESIQKGIIVTDHNYRNILDIADRSVLIHDGAIRQIKNRDDLIRWGYVPGLQPPILYNKKGRQITHGLSCYMIQKIILRNYG